MSDVALKVWSDPTWLQALSEIDREIRDENPRDTFTRRLAAITAMYDIEEKYAEMEREQNER